MQRLFSKNYFVSLYLLYQVKSSQKFNEYIKECCKFVGVDTPTTITRYVGTRRIDKTVPKYELITSHTTRKTFAINYLTLGMDEILKGNDNIIGRIGEFIAFQFLEERGRNPQPVLRLNNPGYDIICDNKKKN